MDRPLTSPQQPEPRGTSRTALVPASRLEGWVDRFAASHGAVEEDFDDDGIILRADDGATALLRAPWPVDGRPGRGNTNVERLASLATQERGLGIVLVRRGGFAIAATKGGRILASKSGNRYVQSRTSAGGQSQQRFARRRSKQADALVDAAAEHVEKIFGPHRIEYIVPGGDRAVVDNVLSARAALAGAKRPGIDFMEIQDPNTAALPKAATDACSIRITVTDPPA